MHIWRVRCKAVFDNFYDHQEFAILKLYSDIFYCLASIFTQLQADSKKSTTTTYQVQCIQHQVVQLIKIQQNGLLHSLQPLIRILINCIWKCVLFSLYPCGLFFLLFLYCNIFFILSSNSLWTALLSFVICIFSIIKKKFNYVFFQSSFLKSLSLVLVQL